MRGWLLANLFIILLVLVGAGLTFAGLWIIARARVIQDLEMALVTAIAGAITIGVYYAGRALYQFFERRVNPNARPVRPPR